MPDQLPASPAQGPASRAQGPVEPDGVPQAGLAPDEPASTEPTPGDSPLADAGAGDRHPVEPTSGDSPLADGTERGPVPAADAVEDEPAAGLEARTDDFEARTEDSEAPGTVPSEEWLAAHAVPGRVRRAPRLGSFVVAGVLVGMVVGTLLTLLAVPRSGLSADGSGGVLPILGGYNGVLLETSLALGLVGGLVGAVLALRADRRSRR